MLIAGEECQVPGSPGTAGLWHPTGYGSLWGPGWCLLALRPCLLFSDFNENGFIDKEDLQRIILRLLNSDDVSEDLLTDLTTHVSTWAAQAWVGQASTQRPRWRAGRCPEDWRQLPPTSCLSSRIKTFFHDSLPGSQNSRPKPRIPRVPLTNAAGRRPNSSLAFNEYITLFPSPPDPAPHNGQVS